MRPRVSDPGAGRRIRQTKIRLRMCSLAARGLWSELREHRRSFNRAGVSLSVEQLGRLTSSTPEEVQAAVADLLGSGVVRGRIADGRVELRWSVGRHPRRPAAPNDVASAGVAGPLPETSGVERTRALRRNRQRRFRARRGASPVGTPAAPAPGPAPSGVPEGEAPAAVAQEEHDANRPASTFPSTNAVEDVAPARHAAPPGGAPVARHASSFCATPQRHSDAEVARPASRSWSLSSDSLSLHRRTKTEETSARARDAPAWRADSGWTGITDDLRRQCAEAFPACDLDRQLAAMSAWLSANPRRAHKSNWARFIVNWLTREQDRGGDHRHGGTADRPPYRGDDASARRAVKAVREYPQTGLAPLVLSGDPPAPPGAA